MLVSEGVHPLTPPFRAAKPVYDTDVPAFIMTLKNKSSKGIYEHYVPDAAGFFNIGAVVRATVPADTLKIKKLANIGADSFIINYSAAGVDKGTVDYIKSENKRVFLSVKESDIHDSPARFAEKNAEYGFDGIIIKIMNEEDNIFMRHGDKNKK